MVEMGVFLRETSREIFRILYGLGCCQATGHMYPEQ